MKVKYLLPTIALILCLLVSLSSCIIIPLRKQYGIDPEKVASVEIYDMRNKNQYNSDGKFFAETETPVCSVEKVADFLSDLSNITFTDSIIIVIAAIDPSFKYGDWVVRINYSDGIYSLISNAGYSQTFDANGEQIDSNHYGCESAEWNELISKYVPGDIFAEKETDSET